MKGDGEIYLIRKGDEMRKPKIYYAHPMRGKLGSKGDGEYGYQNKNSDIAIENVKWLRIVFPQVEWYCPGEVETPVQMFTKLGYITTPQILYMDICVLQQLCQGGLIHRWEPSEGADGEMKRCQELGYPYLLVEESPLIWECNLSAIQYFVKKVLLGEEANEN